MQLLIVAVDGEEILNPVLYIKSRIFTLNLIIFCRGEFFYVCTYARTYIYVT